MRSLVAAAQLVKIDDVFLAGESAVVGKHLRLGAIEYSRVDQQCVDQININHLLGISNPRAHLDQGTHLVRPAPCRYPSFLPQSTWGVSLRHYV
jgi:hypothetical protein